MYLILQPIEIRTPERREAESEDENGPVIGQKVEEPVVEEAVEEVIFWLFFVMERVSGDFSLFWRRFVPKARRISHPA